MEQRRVVITGIGLVTPLGLNVKDSWRRILAGESGVRLIDCFDTSNLLSKIAASISNFKAEDYISSREARKMDRFMQLGVAAASQAIKDSEWSPTREEDCDRTGVIIGAGIGGLKTIEVNAYNLYSNPQYKINPYYIPSTVINLVGGHVSVQYNFSGPNSAISTSCATGSHSIGDASRIIKYGDADVMVAGGVEAPITPTGVGGFTAVKALTSRYNDNPTAASRPWDKERSGFVIGEGAGIVVLEEYNHALKRGAKIYAELTGYGLTGDANHITTPNGRGAYRSMLNALKDSKIMPEQIDYINAHGTSTVIGDLVELNAVQELFQNNKLVKMSSTKSSIGHALGAAGGIEAIFTLLSIRDQVIPATLNLYNPIDEAKIDLVALRPKECKINYAISNSFGFGGTNASLVFKKHL